MTPDEVRDIERSTAEIWALTQKMGLDPFPVHFELVPPTIMYEFGAYGIPGRFSHWTHGRAYQQIKTMYDYGLSKIYELVINADPAHAFLLENNTLLQNTLVVAHVLAHVDFFKHNAYFRRTNRGMLEAASVNAERIHKYEFEHGRDEVERFLDAVLSIQEHVETSRESRVRTRSQVASRESRGALRRSDLHRQQQATRGAPAGAQVPGRATEGPSTVHRRTRPRPRAVAARRAPYRPLGAAVLRAPDADEDHE